MISQDSAARIDAAINGWAGENPRDVDLVLYLIPSAEEAIEGVREADPDRLQGIDDNAIAERICHRLEQLDRDGSERS